MGKVRLTIGDWSKDGHNESEVFVYEVNKTVSQIQKAYKDSCKKTGVQFNHNENYTGLPEHSKYGTPLHICTEYGEYSISKAAESILLLNGIDIGKYINENSELEVEDFAELLMNFIKISLPDLTWEEAAFKKSEIPTIEAINGWWNGELNVQFGYGLFD